MLNINEETKKAFMDGGSRKILTITFFEVIPDGKDESGKDKYRDLVLSNSKIASNSLSIKQSIQNGNKVDFMGCISSTADFTIARPGYILKDKKVQIKVRAEGSDEEIILFTGFVDKVTKDNDTALTCKVSCFDEMNKLLDEKDVTEWYDSLGDFTMNLKSFRDSLFNYLKIEQVDKKLPHDNMIVRKTLDTAPKEEKDYEVRQSQITAATVIQAICQINATFGKITNDGKMDYVAIDMNSDPYEYKNSNLIKVKCEDTNLKKITSVVLYDGTSEEYEDDGTALAYYPEDLDLIKGDKAVPYEINDNFLLYAYDQADARQIAKDIYDTISKVSFMPCDITAYGLPWIECGDRIQFIMTGDKTLYPDADLYPSPDLYPMGYEMVNTVVMTRKLTGPGLFKDDITVKGEDIDSKIKTISEIITAERFYRKIGEEKLYSEIEQTKSEIKLTIYDNDKGVMSQIKQQANRIDLVVERQYKDYSAITTRLELTEKEIAAHAKMISLESEELKVVTRKTSEFEAEMIKMRADVLEFDAKKVNIVDLENENSKTVINGSHITTGTINCSRIGFGQIKLPNYPEPVDVEWNELKVPRTKKALATAKVPLARLLEKVADIETLYIPVVEKNPVTEMYIIKDVEEVRVYKVKDNPYSINLDLFVPYDQIPDEQYIPDLQDAYYVMDANVKANWESYVTLSSKHVDETEFTE